MDIKRCDFVLFTGKGFVFSILSFIMCLLIPEWRRRTWKPWHVGFISRHDSNLGWMVCESLAGGVQENALSKYDKSSYRIFRYFKEEPEQIKVARFLSQNLGNPYSVLTYPFTVVNYFVKWFPRIRFKSVTCWENLYEFADDMGEEICDDHEYPFILGLIKALNL